MQGEEPGGTENVQGMEKDVDAGGRDEAALRPQTQTPGNIATRSQHKALVHMMGELMLNTNKMHLPRLRGHE